MVRVSQPTSKKSNLLFICIAGLPPFDNEFSNLNLPGEVVVKKYSGFGKELSEEEYLQLWKVFNLEHEAKEIH